MRFWTYTFNPKLKASGWDKLISLASWVGLFLILILATSCESEKVLPYVYTGTKLIGHRGNGSIGSGLGQQEENTLPAVREGFRKVDGVELDIQMSRDRTLYVYHDKLTDQCEESDVKSIVAAKDEAIDEYFDCLGIDSPKLKYFLDQKKAQHLSEDLFLDVKLIFDISIVLQTLPPQLYLNLISLELLNELEDYPDKSKIHIESAETTILDVFNDRNESINTWLTSYDEIEKTINRAARKRYTGVMVKDGTYITEETVAEAHEKGLLVSVWIVNEQSRYDELKEMKVDFVQTDNLFIIP